MNRKKWWKIALPFIIAAKIAVIVFIIGSAKPEAPQVVTVPVSTHEFQSVEIPEKIVFAGEEFPINRFDYIEALDRELLSNVYFHSQTIRFIKLAPRYFSIIEPILRENGIPDDFKYLALAESGLNPRAVSPAQAVGLWQFVKNAAQQYGLEVSKEVDERYHVEKSTVAACKYLNEAYAKFGNWPLVAASYNAGLTGISRHLERQKADSYFDLLLADETSRYFYRIAALKLILENPEKYNFFISESEKYPIVKTRDVEVNGPVPNLADFAKEQGISYKLLKDFNPWLRENFLTNPTGKKYIIRIPVLS